MGEDIGEQYLNAGEKFYFGQGVEQSYSEAMKWFLLSSEQNNSKAQNYIAYMYENGYGVEQSYSEAMKWYLLKSGEQNNSGNARIIEILSELDKLSEEKIIDQSEEKNLELSPDELKFLENLIETEEKKVKIIDHSYGLIERYARRVTLALKKPEIVLSNNEELILLFK